MSLYTIGDVIVRKKSLQRSRKNRWHCIEDDPAGIPVKFRKGYMSSLPRLPGGRIANPKCPIHKVKKCLITRYVHHADGCRITLGGHSDLRPSYQFVRWGSQKHEFYRTDDLQRTTCDLCLQVLRRKASDWARKNRTCRPRRLR